MKIKKYFYDWKSNSSYGGGGNWVLNKQRIFNVIVVACLIVLTIIIVIL